MPQPLICNGKTSSVQDIMSSTAVCINKCFWRTSWVIKARWSTKRTACSTSTKFSRVAKTPALLEFHAGVSAPQLNFVDKYPWSSPVCDKPVLHMFFKFTFRMSLRPLALHGYRATKLIVWCWGGIIIIPPPQRHTTNTVVSILESKLEIFSHQCCIREQYILLLSSEEWCRALCQNPDPFLMGYI